MIALGSPLSVRDRAVQMAAIVVVVVVVIIITVQRYTAAGMGQRLGMLSASLQLCQMHDLTVMKKQMS